MCVRAYPGHKQGCPNFGKKDGCPPGANFFEDIYDMTKPVYVIINRFDFKAHVDRMKMVHPDWSKRKLECCLYWQTVARKQLFEGIKKFLRNNDNEHFKQGYKVTTCPEAMGVNVTETMKRSGITLEWPQETVTYQIALAGIPKVQ